MKSFQKIYVLVGMVSLLYGGVSLANFFSSKRLSKSSIVNRRKNENTSSENGIQKLFRKNKKFRDAVHIYASVIAIKLQEEDLSNATLDDWGQLMKGKDYRDQLRKRKTDAANMLNVLRNTKYRFGKKKKNNLNQVLQCFMVEAGTNLDTLLSDFGRQKELANFSFLQGTFKSPPIPKRIITKNKRLVTIALPMLIYHDLTLMLPIYI